jgi:hypothetical protein
MIAFVIGMKADPTKQTKIVAFLWGYFRGLMVVFACMTVFTLVVMMSALESFIPLIYVELFAFLYYFTIGMLISW